MSSKSLDTKRLVLLVYDEMRWGTSEMDEDEDTTYYDVVMSHEEQYSVWPAASDPPAGWRRAGKTGLKADCLSYINEVWTDMRLLSLRRAMEDAARG